MKKINWLIAAVLPLTVLFSCQKQIASEESASILRDPSQKTAANCGTCISSWSASNETIAFSGTAGTSLEVEQNGSSITKLVVTRAAGFNKLKYKVTYYKADNTGAKVLLYHEDPTAAGGSTTSQNLFTYKKPSTVVQSPVVNGENCITTGGGPNAVTTCDVLDNVFPNCWNKCDKVVVEILEMGGAGNPPTQTATYYLRKLCAPAISISANPNPAKVGEPVTISASMATSVCGTLTLQKWNGATWDNVSNSYTFTPTEASTTAECKYKFRAVYAKECGCDYDDATSEEFCLRVLPADATCTLVGNDLTGTAVSCGTSREAIYTFSSQDGAGAFKIQGGLTNFTGANATVYINGTLVNFNTTSTDGWATGTVGGFIVGQRTPGGSSNRNIRVEGGVGTCSDVIIRVIWNSTNSGGVITGSWSVVDANGVELDTPVAGLTCN